MSDAGIYAALETELMNALSGSGGIAGVVTLSPALSVADLADDAVRKPAVGVIDAGLAEKDLLSVSSRRMTATATFEVGVVVASARGKVQARSTLRTVLEAVRDRVHFLPSSQPGTGRWRWKSETPVEVAGDDLIAAVASYQIETLIGR